MEAACPEVSQSLCLYLMPSEISLSMPIPAVLFHLVVWMRMDLVLSWAHPHCPRLRNFHLAGHTCLQPLGARGLFNPVGTLCRLAPMSQCIHFPIPQSRNWGNPKLPHQVHPAPKWIRMKVTLETRAYHLEWWQRNTQGSPVVQSLVPSFR